MKLGRLPSDPAAISRAPQLAGHRMASMPPPPKIVRSQIDFTPSMDDNNLIGNCTAVGIANAARAIAALNGFGIDIPTEKVVDFYSQSTGFDPSDMSTDQGGVELDVLAYQLRNGFEHGGQAPLVGTFATFDPADRALMANAMAKCGAVYLGVDLAEADQDMGHTWDTTTPGDQTPGSYGGHCLIAWDYTGLGDDDVVRLGTWGMWVPATWRWIKDRTEEAHVILWRQLMKASGQNFAGLDYDRLRADNMAWVA